MRVGLYVCLILFFLNKVQRKETKMKKYLIETYSGTRFNGQAVFNTLKEANEFYDNIKTKGNFALRYRVEDDKLKIRITEQGKKVRSIPIYLKGN